jgi:putative ABC transport system ATP-binding protein/lipoprotein-releasing system ATP-binding protein
MHSWCNFTTISFKKDRTPYSDKGRIGLLQIEIATLTKAYTIGKDTIKALDSISLKITKGEFLSIVGHSGSGKTTLLSIIGGILLPTSGRIIFEGADIYSLNRDRLSEYRAEKVGFIFQFASLLPVLTVKENLLLPVLFNSRTKTDKDDEAEKRALGLLEMVGLRDKIDSYPSQLSGGQQRRVAIARAFINDPEVILADEPTGDLDEETETEIMTLFKRMHEEKGITFLLVTHSSDLARHARRRLRMHNGKLLEI